MEGLEISSGASGAPLAEPVPVDPNGQWPKKPSGKAEKHKDGLLKEWQLFKEACPHRAFAPASGMLRLQQFRRWLPRQEWYKDALLFQHFQTLSGRKAPGLGISNSVAGGVKKAHMIQWLDRQWPSVAVPIVAEPVVAAPSSVVAADPPSPSPSPTVDIFKAMMKPPKTSVAASSVPTPKQAPKRSREVSSVAVAAPPPTKKQSGPRQVYALGTAAGDRMEAALKDVAGGMKVDRAAPLHDVDRSALGRIHRGEQELGATPGLDTVIDAKLETDLKTFVLFMFKTGHGFDWGDISDLARRMGKAMGLANFEATSGWIAGFKRRNKELVRRRAQHMERVRAGAMNLNSVTYRKLLPARNVSQVRQGLGQEGPGLCRHKHIRLCGQGLGIQLRTRKRREARRGLYRGCWHRHARSTRV